EALAGFENCRPCVLEIGRAEQRESERLRGIEKDVEFPLPRAVVLDLPGESLLARTIRQRGRREECARGPGRRARLGDAAAREMAVDLRVDVDDACRRVERGRTPAAFAAPLAACCPEVQIVGITENTGQTERGHGRDLLQDQSAVAVVSDGGHGAVGGYAVEARDARRCDETALWIGLPDDEGLGSFGRLNVVARVPETVADRRADRAGVVQPASLTHGEDLDESRTGAVTFARRFLGVDVRCDGEHHGGGVAGEDPKREAVGSPGDVDHVTPKVGLKEATVEDRMSPMTNAHHYRSSMLTSNETRLTWCP